VNLTSILQKVSKEGNLRRYYTRYAKQIYSVISPAKKSIPVFLLGSHRSGTTMMMFVFELSRYFKVYNESHPKAFLRNRIRDFDTIDGLIKVSRLPFTVFKPTMDSYLSDTFLIKFSGSKVIWIYRNYKDKVNSSVKKFQNAGSVIPDIAQGKVNTSWFSEGLIDVVKDEIIRIYKPTFTKYENEALVWWGTNYLVIEKTIFANKNVLLVDYDRLVRHPQSEFSVIFKFIGAPLKHNIFKDVRSTSLHKEPFPHIDRYVEELCEDLSSSLENCIQVNRKLHNFSLAEK